MGNTIPFGVERHVTLCVVTDSGCDDALNMRRKRDSDHGRFFHHGKLNRRRPDGLLGAECLASEIRLCALAKTNQEMYRQWWRIASEASS